jgi:hypothetical protein
MKVNTSSMKRVKFSLFNLNLITRIDKLLEKTRTMKTTKNGESSMLMSLDHSLTLDIQRLGVCILTDHSISKLE